MNTMQLKELYSKDITRHFNPAVSATSFDGDTPRTEIEEYVFTDEIMNGLYRVLRAIKDKEDYKHVGIWIDGYYGSGKSHFLKYLDYCIRKEYQQKALDNFIAAREEIDPLDDSHDLEFDAQELRDVARWLLSATVDNSIFNLETSFNQSTDRAQSFLQIFWNEFNKLRGFNEFNITLAQTLEKPLRQKGVFDAFKAKIDEVAGEAGYWDKAAADLVDQELDLVLGIAREVAPTLTIDSIRKRIIDRDYNVSIESFARELKGWLDEKGADYRLILLVDEVSQFINNDRDRYLNLQEIITRLSEACDNNVWIACTAQQDLSEVLSAANVVQGREDMGKIMGRFEVKVSLRGTQPEFITQKRILDKREPAKLPLRELYKKEKDGFSQRFALPTTYKGYTSSDIFVDYYPFVPYQLQLIMKVFDNFLQLGYVAKEVKGNERSIIRVVHSTARKAANEPLGTLISFDRLYDNMFDNGLQARGQKARSNAEKMAKEYADNPANNPNLALRVVNVLFMVCNISETEKLLFPATLQNVTTLLLNDFTTPFLTLREDVRKVVDYLCEKSIIREEKPQKGHEPYYTFYSEEEMNVAELIKSQRVDNTYQADALRDIIQRYFTSLRNKEPYMTRSFAVGASVMERKFLSNNPDVEVEFNMESGATVERMLMSNPANTLLFLCGEKFHADRKLINDFIWYCMVQKYAETPRTTKENDRVRDEFEKRAKELLETSIVPKLRDILDTCPVMSGTAEVDPVGLNGKKGAERYTEAIRCHLRAIYPHAGMVANDAVFPRDTASLKAKILRPVNTGDYDGMGATLTPPEQEVERWLVNQGSLDVNLSSITAHFAQRPFGWLETSTLYVVNELVRRHRRDFSYANNSNVDATTVANRIMSETNKFAVRAGHAIPQEVVNNFVKAWRQVFGQGKSFGSTDSTQIFRTAQEYLLNACNSYETTISANRQYHFITPLTDAVDLFRRWAQIRDVQRFFTTVIEEASRGAQMLDVCREVVDFIKGQLPLFREIVRFTNDNRSNFEYLSAEYAPVIAELNKLATKQWPIRIVDYKNQMKAVKAALDQVRANYREQIKAAYDSAYNDLCASATSEGVDASIIAEPSAAYSVKCLTESILALDHNTNTDDYFQREAEKIIAAKQAVSKPTPKPPKPADHKAGQSTPPTPPTPPAPESCTLNLNTRVVGLASEADVDAYLARLKAQIMAEINQNRIVTITK